jgi:hypothetical protein
MRFKNTGGDGAHREATETPGVRAIDAIGARRSRRLVPPNASMRFQNTREGVRFRDSQSDRSTDLAKLIHR